MAAQKGRDVLIKIDTGSGYIAIGGTRTKTITINNTPVDVTNSDDSGVRKLLEGAGVNNKSVKLQGVYMDDTYIGQVRTLAATNAHKNFQIVIPGATSDGTYQGSFMVASFEETGAYNEGMTYNITLESADDIQFTAT